MISNVLNHGILTVLVSPSACVVFQFPDCSYNSLALHINFPMSMPDNVHLVLSHHIN